PSCNMSVKWASASAARQKYWKSTTSTIQLRWKWTVIKLIFQIKWRKASIASAPDLFIYLRGNYGISFRHQHKKQKGLFRIPYSGYVCSRNPPAWHGNQIDTRRQGQHKRCFLLIF